MKRIFIESAACGFLVAATIVVAVLSARATDCPVGAKSCRVLTITPEEEQALVAPNGILDTAERARFLDLSAATKYFRDKIQNAPAGDVKAPAPPSEPTKP